jgi:hypothetical protein
MFGPLVAFGGIIVLIIILRWAFGGKSSLVERQSTLGKESDYGLMVPVTSPTNFIEGEMYRRLLEDSGLRSNLATTLDGPKLMVWPNDLARAKEIIKQNPKLFRE